MNAGHVARTNALVTGASGSAYFEFTVTPTAGSSLSLTNFTVGSRQSGSGRLLMTLLSSLDSYTTASGGQATFSAVISGAGLVTKTGSGTVTFAGSAANTFSGATTVSDGTLELASTPASSLGSTASVSVASGATLLVSQANQVNNSASVSLTGGTIRTAIGVSEVFGNLSLASASFLDFSTTSHANANSISFGTYMPSALLTINNFNFGSTPVFGSNLTSTINNSSFFTSNNGGIASYARDNVSSTFTITAIPEPSTYVAAVGLLGLILWPARRRLIGRA